jgi:hypothetical protein
MRARRSQIEAFFKEPDYDYFDIAAARNPKTKAKVLRKLSASTCEALRTLVAGHKNCPDDVLLKLSKDKTPSVREAVASNKSTSVALKKQMLMIIVRTVRKVSQSPDIHKSAMAYEGKGTILRLLEYIISKQITLRTCDLLLIIPLYKTDATNLDIIEEAARLQGGKLKRRVHDLRS